MPGAPSGPRSNRPVIPPGTKDASHPDFASQARPPPSGPSKFGPTPRGPAGYGLGARQIPSQSQVSLQHPQAPTPHHHSVIVQRVTIEVDEVDTLSQIEHVSILGNKL